MSTNVTRHANAVQLPDRIILKWWKEISPTKGCEASSNEQVSRVIFEGVDRLIEHYLPTSSDCWGQMWTWEAGCEKRPILKVVKVVAVVRGYHDFGSLVGLKDRWRKKKKTRRECSALLSTIHQPCHGHIFHPSCYVRTDHRRDCRLQYWMVFASFSQTYHISFVTIPFLLIPTSATRMNSPKRHGVMQGCDSWTPLDKPIFISDPPVFACKVPKCSNVALLQLHHFLI